MLVKHSGMIANTCGSLQRFSALRWSLSFILYLLKAMCAPLAQEHKILGLASESYYLPLKEYSLMHWCQLRNWSWHKHAAWKGRKEEIVFPSFFHKWQVLEKQLGVVVRAKWQGKPNRKTKAPGNWGKMWADCQQSSWQKLENYVKLKQITPRADSQEKRQGRDLSSHVAVLKLGLKSSSDVPSSKWLHKLLSHRGVKT